MTDISLFSLIQAGLVFSATMAWSDTVQTGTKLIYPHNEEKVFETKLIYALILTFVIILIFYFIQKTKNELIHLQEDVNKWKNKNKPKIINPYLY